MAEKMTFRQNVAEEMLSHIEAGTAPWQKPWQPNVAFQPPFNPVTGKAYRGINNWWLELQGHEDPRWMTYRQAEGLGAQVRKGETGTSIEYWQWTEREKVLGPDGSPIRDGNGKEQYRNERPKVFYARVFNAEQIDGLEPLQRPELKFEPIEAAEKVIANIETPIHHDQADSAHYLPGVDTIHMPVREAFPNAYEYYSTLLHEAGHSTGHTSRLDRDYGPFGSEKYAVEELRAEMASYMVSREIGLGHYPDRHAGYVEVVVTDGEPDHLGVVADVVGLYRQEALEHLPGEAAGAAPGGGTPARRRDLGRTAGRKVKRCPSFDGTGARAGVHHPYRIRP